MRERFNIEKESAIPLYSQLLTQLEQKIDAEKYHPGEKFYTEYELVNLTGLSRPTIRQAISELVNKGMLIKEHGRGTFVRPKNNTITPNSGGKENKYKRIALIMPWLAGTFFSPLLEEVEEAAYRAGFNVVLANNHNDRQCEMARIRELLKNGVDGLLWMCATGGANPAFAKQIINSVPVVTVDRTLLYDEPGISSVESDNSGGLKQAVKYLLNKGRRKIAYISSRSKLDSVIQREEGYRAALFEAGIKACEDWIFRGRSDFHSNGISGAEKILKSGIAFDGICCVTDDTAAGAIEKLCAADIRIPEDVAVVGFNNDRLICETTSPKLTSVNQDIRLMGRKAAELLIAKLRGQEETKKVKIPVSIAERESA